MSALLPIPSGRTALVAQIDLRGPHRRTALRARIAAVVETLTGVPSDQRRATGELLDQLEGALREAHPDRIWLAQAVISGQLPDPMAVIQGVRLARMDGALAGVAHILTVPAFPLAVPGRPWPTVRILDSRVLVDLHHTAATDLATGIQRVARQTAARWDRDHDITLVGWNGRHTGLRELSDIERDRALGLAPRSADSSQCAPTRDELNDVVVPWRSTYLVPELITEPRRNLRLQSLLRYSGNVGGYIGFDLVPLTSAETTAEGMGFGFSTSLAAVAHARRLAAISNAAATEFEGWQEMLAGAGFRGPEIAPIALPIESVEPSARAIREARELLVTDELPMVLCVGSHEPRKNHLAVLHAAEMLWREGVEFSLVFVGGNSWSGERFADQLDRMRATGRLVTSIRALPDDLLWAAYRLAHCLVFPSLNEGFGLPVAESLAMGTPVVTSQFGSMYEIAGHGGAILVDPRDDHDIVAGLRQMLTDGDLHRKLSQQAQNLPIRTWDEYAKQTWDFLMDEPTAQPTAGEPR